MISSSSAHELIQLLHVLFRQSYWTAFVQMGNEVKQLTPDSVHQLSPEKATGIKRFLDQQAPNLVFNLPPFHYLFEEIQLKKSEVNIGIRFRSPIEQILVIGSDINKNAFYALNDLWIHKQQELVYRQQIAQLLDKKQQEIQQLQQRIIDFQQQHEVTTQEWIKNWIQNQRTPITIHEECLPVLSELSNEQAVHFQLDHALKFAQFLYPTNKTIELIPDFLPQQTEGPIQKEQPVRSSLQERVIVLLDKYEESAIQCARQNAPISGKYVAANLVPSVSPPAITDALKKHKKTIRTLFHLYPEKWKLIRNGLKPLKEMSAQNQTISI